VDDEVGATSDPTYAADEPPEPELPELPEPDPLDDEPFDASDFLAGLPLVPAPLEPAPEPEPELELELDLSDPPELLEPPSDDEVEGDDDEPPESPSALPAPFPLLDADAALGSLPRESLR